MVVLLLLVPLAACAPIGVSTPQTFDERLAASVATVSAVRTSTTTLLRENLISAEDAQRLRAQADDARSGIDVAKALHATEPGASDTRLAAVRLDLNGLQTYLNSRRPVSCPLIDC
jgi:hypothetical protein